MNDFLRYLAWRVVQGIRPEPGELVLVLDHAGREGLAQEIGLQLDVMGATPLIEFAPPDYVAALLRQSRIDALTHFTKHRAEWWQRADKIIALSAGTLDLGGVPQDNVEAWARGQEALTEIEEARNLPNLVVAVPTQSKAQQSNTTLDALDAHIEPAMRATLWDLQRQIERISIPTMNAQSLLIKTDRGHELRLRRGGRAWLADDGYIDPSDIARGAIVSNLPAGSLYTTVIEDSAEGSLFVARAGPARNVVFHFQRGRAVVIEAESGAEELNAYFDAHTGEPRRISHFGIGLNPFLQRRIGWTLVDEHVLGALFIAFGENRYMDGQNVSSLNEDYPIEGASVFADTHPIMLNGQVMG
jgi:leucyl aminopeptidase (aminopeptidase T)